MLVCKQFEYFNKYLYFKSRISDTSLKLYLKMKHFYERNLFNITQNVYQYLT